MRDISKIKTAYTHGSIFHSDDVFAAAMLLLINPDIEIVRTNDKDWAHSFENDEDKIVFDIGEGEYDHHQKEKAVRPWSDGYVTEKSGKISQIPYCAFGHLWADFGRLLVMDELAWKKIDRDLVLPIDKQDNGYASSTLSSMIAQFNPNWNDDCSEGHRFVAFIEAVGFAQKILQKYIASANAVSMAKEEIERNSRVEDRILVLDKYLPWQDAVVEGMPDILFVVFPSGRHEGRYNVQTVPDAPGSFTGRKLFPVEWLGNTDDKLGITFCHTNNFLLEAVDLEHALKCAKTAAEN